MYVYRNHPFHAGETGCWAVTGIDILSNEYGVLEWCLDADDAVEVFERMKKFPQFENLGIEQWN